MSSLPPLAKPTFITGASDTLATPDVYTLKNPGVITSVQSFLANAELSISQALKGGPLAGVSLPLIKSVVGQVATINKSNLISKLISASPVITSALKSLSSGTQDNFTSSLSDTSQFTVAMGNVTSKVASTNYSDVSQIGSLVNAFTGTTGAVLAVDKSALSSVVSGVVNSCTSLGIANAFGVVTSGITDAAILAKAAQQCLPSVIKSSDISSLTSMASALSSGSLTKISSSVLSAFGASYTTKSLAMIGTKTAATTLSAVTSAYSAVNSSWNTTTRNGSSVINATAINDGSSAFKTMVQNGAMTSTDSNATAYSIATLYGPTSVSSSLSSSYSNLTLTTGSAAAATIDPATMIYTDLA